MDSLWSLGLSNLETHTNWKLDLCHWCIERKRKPDGDTCQKCKGLSFYVNRFLCLVHCDHTGHYFWRCGCFEGRTKGVHCYHCRCNRRDSSNRGLRLYHWNNDRGFNIRYSKTRDNFRRGRCGLVSGIYGCDADICSIGKWDI